MGEKQKFIVRTMNRKEIDLAIEWAAGEGWNPGLHDATAYYAIDPNGFFIGLLDGEPIGCISAVAYDDTYGFIGFYIVRPEFRGKGFGIKIWDTAIKYLGDRNAGLDGVVAQQGNYKKSGFKLAYSNVRYEGVGGGKCPAGVIDLSKVPFEDVLVYDAPFFPVNRSPFLKSPKLCSRPFHLRQKENQFF